MTWIFIQNFIECVNCFFILFAFNQVKASLKGFIVNDNNSSDPSFLGIILQVSLSIKLIFSFVRIFSFPGMSTNKLRR